MTTLYLIVSWSSTKQSYIASFTTKLEYISCLIVVHEGIWLRRFIQKFDITTYASKLVTIYCDSMVIVAYAKNKYYDRTKHIGIKYHFI